MAEAREGRRRSRVAGLLGLSLAVALLQPRACAGYRVGPGPSRHTPQATRPQKRAWLPIPTSKAIGWLAQLSPAALGAVLGLRPLPLQPPLPARAEEAVGASVGGEGARQARPDDLFDEVWKLTGKFYLDRSFGGHDWEQVRKDLRTKVVSGDANSEVKATKAMLKMLGDRYTQLLSPYMYTEMSRFDPIGAGFMLSIDDDGYFCVSSDPREGTEAARQRIEKGDKILNIDGVAVKGKSVFDAVDLITKDDRTDVRLTVQSHKDASTRDVVLPRDFEAVSNPVKYSLATTPDKRRVGYVKLREFNSLAKAKIQEAIEDLEARGAEEYVLDLRGNPGGSVQAAVSVAGLFLRPAQVVTYIQDATGNRLPLRTQGAPPLPQDPLLVWTDKRSASASEILAAALHDNCRATLMGQRTFGKGLVQGVFGLSDGKGLIMTVAKYETPTGASIQGTGIHPDIPAKLPSPLIGDQDLSMLRPEDFSLKPSDACPAPAS